MRTPLALFLLAIGVRSMAALGLGVIPRDSTVYVDLAREAASAPAAAFTGMQHPLFPLLAGFLGGSEAAATVLAIVAGSLGTFAAFRIGVHLHSRAAGVLAALLYAVAPGVVRYESVPLGEALYLPLLLFSVERALAAAEDRAAGYLSGLLAGLAYLARPEGILLLLLPVALLVRRRPGGAAYFLVAFLATGGLYASWLSLDAGKLVLSRKKPVARFVSAEEGFDAHMERKSKFTGLSRPGVGEAVLDTARTLGEATSWVLLALAVPGAILLARRGPARAAALTLLALLAVDLAIRYRLLHLHGYLGRRHLAAAACLTIPFAAVGLICLARRRVAVAAGILAAVLLVISVRPRDLDKVTLKEAGRWIGEQSAAAAVVATWRAPRISYYAEGTDLPLHRAEDYAEEMADADWLAFVPDRVEDPEVRKALEEAAAGMAHRDFGEGIWRVRVYALTRTR